MHKADEIAEAVFNQLTKSCDQPTMLAIADYFQARLKRVSNVTEVTTAVPLSSNEKTKLREKLEKIAPDTEIAYKTDPAVIGGLVIRTPDKVIDASIKKDLTDLMMALG